MTIDFITIVVMRLDGHPFSSNDQLGHGYTRNLWAIELKSRD